MAPNYTAKLEYVKPDHGIIIEPAMTLTWIAQGQQTGDIRDDILQKIVDVYAKALGVSPDEIPNGPNGAVDYHILKHGGCAVGPDTALLCKLGIDRITVMTMPKPNLGPMRDQQGDLLTVIQSFELIAEYLRDKGIVNNIERGYGF